MQCKHAERPSTGWVLHLVLYMTHGPSGTNGTGHLVHILLGAKGEEAYEHKTKITVMNLKITNYYYYYYQVWLYVHVLLPELFPLVPFPFSFSSPVPPSVFANNSSGI